MAMPMPVIVHKRLLFAISLKLILSSSCYRLSPASAAADAPHVTNWIKNHIMCVIIHSVLVLVKVVI